MNRRNEMGGVRVDRQRYMRWGATRCPDWRSPLPNATLQASRGEEGGENQDGGAWGRMEVLHNPFIFIQTRLFARK